METFKILLLLLLIPTSSVGEGLLAPVDGELPSWEEEYTPHDIYLDLEDPQFFHYKVIKEDTFSLRNSKETTKSQFLEITISATNIELCNIENSQKKEVYQLKDQKDITFITEEGETVISGLVATLELENTIQTLIATPASIEIIKVNFLKGTTTRSWGRRVQSELIPKVLEQQRKIKLLETSNKRAIIGEVNQKSLLQQQE